MKPGKTGIARIIDATRYSFNGMRASWKTESAFRQEVCLTVVLTPLAFWLGQSPVEYALLIGSCLIVLTTELLNTAVEMVVDRVGSEYHDLAGRAKDAGSAAVFMSLLFTTVVWGAIIYQRFAA
ncbi:MAG: diacylglycerol kinase [Gammaproteobacteria bacterium]|nr:diacylglycerol kinase [Gammaproteobacteria bacterium]